MRWHVPTALLVVGIQCLALGVIAHRLEWKGWTWQDLPPWLQFSQRAFTPVTMATLGTEECSLLSARHFTILSQRVVLGETVVPAAVEVQGGKISKITRLDDQRQAATLEFGMHTLDYGELIISPGLIDTHTHMDEPGREHWEGFATGTQAAAAGGLTTLIDMPLNNVPSTTTGELVAQKLAASQGKLWVDVGLWGGITPDNARNASVLLGMLDAGALGFKSFMSPSGSDFPNVAASDVQAALPVLQRSGVPYYIHAELPFELPPQGQADPRAHATWLATRPDAFETAAQGELLHVMSQLDANASAPGFRLHLAHVSSVQALPLLAAAKRQGVPITAETCPHYLAFASEDIPDGATSFKCAPPIRSRENREELWRGLLQGTLDGLATDHSPAPPEMKSLDSGNFLAAWGGIAGLQYALPATWTAMSARKLGPQLLTKWWSTFPAQLTGLANRKGAIVVGLDADFVVWDPNALADTSADALLHRHKLSPFADLHLRGRVHATYVRGQLVFSDADGTSNLPCGNAVLKQDLAPARSIL